MNLRGKVIIQAVAVMLVFAVVQVYVQANLVPTRKTQNGAVHVTGTPLGRLTTRGNNAVTVNGNNAKTGETISSGAVIQTPEGVGATVQLGPLGQVDIAPGTVLTVNFNADGIDLEVTSGCVVLTPGVDKHGTVTTPGANVARASGTSPLDICVGSGAAPVVGEGAAAEAGAGAGGATPIAGGVGTTSLGTSGTIGFFTSAAMMTSAATIRPCRRGANPSPGVPRGRNDECRR